MRTRREFLEKSSLGVCAVGLASLAEPAGEKGRTGFVYDDIYLTHVLERSEYEIPDRLRSILAEMKRQGLASEVTPISRLSAPMPFIERLHTTEHVASIRQIPVTGQVAEAAVGGALAAVKAVSEGRVGNAFCAIRPPGHHANNTGEEEGFCYYGNAAIATRYAQSLGHERILIIDWDYHHGNGTQNAFYSDPSVLFFSTHDWQAYPGTGDPSLEGAGDGAGLNINIHLDCGSKDKDMLDSWDRSLLPAAERFQPDFVLVSAGFDSRKDDLLGCFDVTDDAFARMTRATLDLARRHCEGRVVSLLEGGYNLEGLAKAASAHVAALLGS